jgi:hypothetical protein
MHTLQNISTHYNIWDITQNTLTIYYHEYTIKYIMIDSNEFYKRLKNIKIDGFFN